MYTQYYGLRAQPFRMTPDPSYFFSSDTHKSALAYLRYGMQQGEGFIVVTGAPGTGKTTLALTLIEGLPRNEVVFGELLSTQLQPEDLLRAIAAAFALDVSGTKSDLIVRLQEFFSTRVRAGKQVLLLVDEAHDLPQVSFKELQMLSNFHQGPQALLQCILLGQPPLRDILTQTTMDQFQQRVVAAHHLVSLSLNETRSYILHRLQQAGWRGEPSFTANAISLIHQYTQGVPRRINALCTRLMLYGFIEEKHQINAAATTQVYNEWSQELGRTTSVVPIRQPKLEEINIAGLTQEHVMLGRAVGADAHTVLDLPTARKNVIEKASPATSKLHTEDATPLIVQNKITASSQAPAVQPDDLESLSLNAPSPPTLIDIVSQRSYPLMPDSNQHSAHQARPHYKPPWLLLTVIVLVSMIIPVNYLIDHSIYYQFSADNNARQSHIKTAVSPQKIATAVPEVKRTRSPTETPLRSEQVSPDNMTNSAGNTRQITITKSKIATSVPQAKGISPSNHALNDKPAKHASKVTITKKESITPPLPPGTKLKPKAAVHTKSVEFTQPNITAHQLDDPTLRSTVKPSVAQISIAKATTTEHENATLSPPVDANLQSLAASDTSPSMVNPQNTREPQPDESDIRSTVKPSLASVSVAYANPGQPSIGVNKVTTSIPITIDEVRTFLNRFRDAYESGNTDELASLLADDAHSDKEQGRDAIVRSYRKLFNLSDDRHLVLSNLQWQSAGDTVQCEGRVGLNMKEKGRDRQSLDSGKISLRIENRNGQLLITALNYRYTH